MTTFRQLESWQDPDLVLPIRGTEYRIPAPSASDGLRLVRLALADGSNLSNTDEIDEIARLLGATWDDEAGRYTGGLWSRMEADGLTWPELLHAGQTALLHFTLGEATALAHWESRDQSVEPAGKASPPDASAQANAEAPSPALPAPTAETTRAAGRGKKRRKSGAGTSQP